MPDQVEPCGVSLSCLAILVFAVEVLGMAHDAAFPTLSLLTEDFIDDQLHKGLSYISSSNYQKNPGKCDGVRDMPYVMNLR